MIFRKSITIGFWALLMAITSYEHRTGRKEMVYLSIPEQVEEQQAEAETEEDPDWIEYMAKCVEAEAGNQGYYGKRLVADVILNRVDSDRFPDDVRSVIIQRGQFAVYPHAMSRVTPTEETYEAIRAELAERTDEQILFFTAGSYNKYCIPAYKYGDHYFGY